MGDIVTRLFDTDGFPPRRECGTGWTPELVWLHIGSDPFIRLAYLSIPLVLLYFVRRRQDLPFSRLFVLFALFILACGFTHAIDALIFYSPVYRLGGVVKLVTAVVSWATVIALVPVVPRALELMAVLAKAKTETAVHRPIREAQQTRLRGYIVAILAGVLAVLVRGSLDPFLQTDHLFIVSLLAVVFVSWRSGFGPGLATLLVSMAGITYFFVSPRNSWVVEGSGTSWRWRCSSTAGCAAPRWGRPSGSPGGGPRRPWPRRWPSGAGWRRRWPAARGSSSPCGSARPTCSTSTPSSPGPSGPRPRPSPSSTRS